MKKRTFKIIIVVVSLALSIFLLFPITSHLDDGGTVVYEAKLYSVHNVHRIDRNSETGYQEGTIIKILGMEVFNNVK